MADDAVESVGVAGTSSVEFIRSDLFAVLPEYELINDCLAGQRIIKLRGPLYLPRPDAGELDINDPKSIARYEAYKQRAVFYNVAQWTLDGLVGEVFLRPPVVEVPNTLDAVIKDANGDGVSLDQSAKTALSAVLGKGRGGVLVDYPKKIGATTVAEQRSGEVRPTICFYQPENIINWKQVKKGGKWILTLVVLKEVYDDDENNPASFVTRQLIRYRVLRLTNGAYSQEIHESDDLSVIAETINVLDGQGQPLPEIPFMFIGAKDNGVPINPAPLLAICNLNIAHYRNSADYEESVFMLGQPTAVATGLTKQWVDDVLPNGFRVGARGGIPLPVGATFGIVQVQPNTLVKEAMDTKEDQMRALGAKLVEKTEVAQTATEVKINSAAETSVLQSCANNVQAAFKWALEWCSIFVGAVKYADDATVRGAAVSYEINCDFDIMRITWQERGQLLKELQANAITTPEYRAVMRSAGIATLDDEDFEAQQSTEIMAGIERQAELIKAEAAAGGQNNQPGGAPAAGQ